MQSDPLSIHIDLAAMQANFFRRLQHQLDVTKVLQVGCGQVTAEQVAEQGEFGVFRPARGAQLKHDEAKAEAQDWLIAKPDLKRLRITSSGILCPPC